MADDDNRNNKDGYDPDRRKFLKNTGILAGGDVGGSVLGGLLTSQFLPKQETVEQAETITELQNARDRKSTRLNSSHVAISYAVFCLIKRNKDDNRRVKTCYR